MFYDSLQSQIWISRRPLNLGYLLINFAEQELILGDLVGWANERIKFGSLARIRMDNPG